LIIYYITISINFIENMRTLKQLIPLLIEELQTDKYNGMCTANLFLLDKKIISWDEFNTLRALIKKARPNRLEIRYYCKNGGNSRTKEHAYYWTPGKLKPRIKWLKKQLQKEIKKEKLLVS
jgi:hypothetical protein